MMTEDQMNLMLGITAWAVAGLWLLAIAVFFNALRD